jgi:threonine/homoserine/homoserine lactone efflux protein
MTGKTPAIVAYASASGISTAGTSRHGESARGADDHASCPAGEAPPPVRARTFTAMNEAIGQILPFAVGVGLSPFPIIAIVLMLSTPRARSNGPAFLVGWIVGLGGLGAIVLVASSGIGATDDSEPAGWVAWLKIVLGLLLLLVAVKQWRGRNVEKPEPKWMQSINHFTPLKSGGIGILLAAVNPKNLLLTVGAAAAIAETGIEPGQELVALAVFVVIGTIGVGGPVFIYFALGERSAHILEGLKSWMAANNTVIMAILMLVIGAKLLGDGIAGL